jgi:hypothetical protein
VVAAHGGLVVMLDAALDDELAREGVARELNRAAQDLRKRARLPYHATVQLAVVVRGDGAGGSLVERALRDHAAWLSEQAGSAALVRDSLGAELSATLDIDGASVTIELAPVAGAS